MKHLYWDDIKTLGVQPLTGEADSTGMRLLCDLSEQGVLLVEQYLGLHSANFPNNWNSMVGDKPAVASVMLTRSSLWELARFALYMQNYDYVVEIVSGSGNQYVALLRDDKHTQAYLELCQRNGNMRLHRNPLNIGDHPRAADRNVHLATGRTV